MNHLYVVGTPIGNLEDITLRALRVLNSVNLILCEDTRVTRKLLAKHNINVPTLSYHAHSKLSRIQEIVSLLKKGKNLALVSDAGTPGISDPGAELTAKVRQECGEEINSGKLKIESVPGPSALTAALSVAGIHCADFTFLGFLPHKKRRETLFGEIAAAKRTVVFYESPRRLMKSLQSLVKYLETNNSNTDESNLTPRKKVTVCKELTKVFEEVVSGTATEVEKYFKNHANKIRGEFVVIVSE
jgi:16S rRNA (cytidine1402-2'-O)-methyltransferase